MNTLYKNKVTVISIVLLTCASLYACPPIAIIDIQNYDHGIRDVEIQLGATLTFEGDRSSDDDGDGQPISGYYWYVWEDGASEPIYNDYDYYTGSSDYKAIPFDSLGVYKVKLQVRDDEGYLSATYHNALNTCTIIVTDGTSITPPEIDNGLPQVQADGTVIFNGTVSYDSGQTPNIKVYYGTTDGQQSTNWQSFEPISTIVSNEFSTSAISGMDPGTLYFFRSYVEYASNPSEYNDWDETVTHNNPNPINFITAPGQATYTCPNGDEQTDIPINTILTWTTGEHDSDNPDISVIHKVYLEEQETALQTPKAIITNGDTQYNPSLSYGVTYQWRVDEIIIDSYNGDVERIKEGLTWTFTVQDQSTMILDKNSGAGSVSYKKTQNQSFIPVELPYSKAFVDGTGIEVKAVLATYYAFVRWEDSTGQVYSTENPVQLTLEDDLSLTAIFEFAPESPLIQNIGTSQIGKNSARIQGDLISTGGENPDVFLYYDEDGGGETAGDWANPPESVGNRGVGTIYYDLGGLEAGREYFFRFSASNSWGTDWADTVLSFITAPGEATGFLPENGTNIPIYVDLDWQPGQGAVSHNVYLGTTDPPSLRAVVSAPPYTVGPLKYNEDYYWRIDEVGVQNCVTAGEVKTFSSPSGHELIVETTGVGTVTVDDGENDTPSMYLAGDIVALSATSASGYYFVEWQGDTSGSTVINGTDIEVPMDQARTITAVFSPWPTITVSIQGEGEVVIDPSQEYYDFDQVVSIQAVPDTAAGYVFDHWEQNLSGNNLDQSLTMDTSKSITAVFSRKVYFVSASEGNDSYTGLSWDESFATLQKALDMAEINPDYQMWVAAEIYYPTEEQIQGDVRSASFVLVDNIKIYGGFAGDEASVNERDVDANVTILSGDIGILDDNADNSYHVVIGANDTVLDGFTITKGNANGDGYPGNCGAGILCDNVSPMIQNCIITKNNAVYSGGMFNYMNEAKIINCTFVGNTVDETGGAVQNAKCLDITFRNCEFVGNIDNGQFSTFPNVSINNIDSSYPDAGWHWEEGYDLDDYGACTVDTSYILSDAEQEEEIVNYYVEGDKEYLVRWGKPVENGGWEKSGLGFTGRSEIDFQVNTPIEIGRLRHLNYTIGLKSDEYPSLLTVPSSVQLNIKLNFDYPSGLSKNVTFMLKINETDNSCTPYPKCSDDIITFPSSYSSELIEIEGKLYTLKILGFGDDPDNLFDEFKSAEGNVTNSALLWAEIIPPPVDASIRNLACELVNIDNCVFVGNHSSAWGGAISNWACGNVLIHNSTISGNHGSFCGGIYSHESDIDIVNSILWGNTDNKQPGDTNYSFLNKQLYNISDECENSEGCNSRCTVTDSCIQDDAVDSTHFEGAGNIDDDPIFISNPDPGLNGWDGVDDDYGDLRLSNGSLCIDAGNNDLVPTETTTDLDGQPRFVDDPLTDPDPGSGTPPVVDIGAYEYCDDQTPVAVDDTAFTKMNVAIEIDVLSNDSDDDEDAIEISSFTDSLNGGTVALTNDGERILYTPATDFVGVDSFTYEIREVDNPDVIASAEVVISVTDLVVDAGQEKQIVLPESSVYLFDAQAEGGLAGSVISCLWEEVRLPVGVRVDYLPDRFAEKPTVAFDVNPEVFAVESPAVAVLRLKAFENGNFAGQDEVRILIYPGQADAHSGPGVEIDAAEYDTDFVQIPAWFWDDGKPVGYLEATWSQVSGPGQAAFSQDTFVIRADQGETIALDSGFDATTNVTFTAAGTYRLKLNVWDGNKQNSAYVDIEAGAAYLNQPPIVNAGGEILHEATASEVDIDLSTWDSGASHSSASDPDGDSLEIQWTKVSGPLDGVTFDDTTVAAPVLTFTQPGNYVFKLQASDGFFTVDDLLSVCITTPDVSMYVYAGDDQTVPLPSDATLTGAVDGDTPTGVTWSVIKRPVWGQVEFSGLTETPQNEYQPIVTFKTPGTYIFQFEAKKGMVSVSDTVTVYVYPGLQASGGYAYSLLRDEDGYVWSYGEDTNPGWSFPSAGVLGRDYIYNVYGFGLYQLYPKRVYSGKQSLTEPYLENIKDVSAGYTKSFAVEEGSGKVWAWGGSSFAIGELGRPELSEDLYGSFYEPMEMYANESNPDFPDSQIENISTVIAAGKWNQGGHSLLLDNDEHVLACGKNEYGQLGIGTFDDGTDTPVNLPMYVVGGDQGGLILNNIIAVDGGVYFSLALEKDNPLNDLNGCVYSWGANTSWCQGALGIANSANDGIPVPAPRRVHSGQQDPDNSNTSLENIIKIAAGQGFCMALEKYNPKNDCYGRVFTWGRELKSVESEYLDLEFSTEALGDGPGSANQYEPVLVLSGEQRSLEDDTPLTGIIAISAGEGHAMALEKRDSDNGYYGRVFTWGANKYLRAKGGDDYVLDAEACGVLGNGKTGSYYNSPVPVIVLPGEQDPENSNNPNSFLKNIVSIAAGAHHCMAIDMDGKIWAWGINGSGQLGTGDRSSCALPRLVTFGQKVHNVTLDKWYYGEIQGAIDEASDDDEIVVYPGQYTEAIVCDRPLFIHSVNPSDWGIVNKTIIDGTNLDLTDDEALVSITAPDVELRGFTIQHSPEHGIKVTASQSGDDTIMISNNIISNNEKNGIDATSPYIEITNNFVCKNGLQGIKFSDSAARNVINNTIVLNQGYGVYYPSGSNDVENSIVWNNISGQLENCDPDNSIYDTDPGLINSPTIVDRTTKTGSLDRVYVSDTAIYVPGQIIEYNDDGILRVVTVIDTTYDYVKFSPALTSSATEKDKVVSSWYSIDSVINQGNPVITSENGDGYNGDEYEIEIPSSEINNFEIGDIIRYEGQYREILGINETEYTLMVYDGGMAEGTPLDSPSEAGNNLYKFGNPVEWGLSLEENYHLRYSDTSLSIDQITPWSGVENQTDVDGQPRLMGASVDIGADEYTSLDVEAGTNKELQMPVDGSVASLHLSEASVLWEDFENDQYPEGEVIVEWSVVSSNSEYVEFHGQTETPESEIRPTVTFAEVGSYLLQLTAVDPQTSTVIGGDRIAVEILPGIDAGGPYEVINNKLTSSPGSVALEGLVSGLDASGYIVSWSVSDDDKLSISNQNSLTEACVSSKSAAVTGLYGIQLEITDTDGKVLGSDTALVICNDQDSPVSAGLDQKISLSPVNSSKILRLCGSVTGYPASHVEWELISGSNNTITFTAGETDYCSPVEFSGPGIYEFAFHAYDEHYREIGVDIVAVTVEMQAVAVDAGQDRFINSSQGDPYILNLQGTVSAEDISLYTTQWFCTSNYVESTVDVQFGNAGHPETWARFTTDPAPGKYTCILVAYDSEGSIVAADSLIITVDDGDISIPSPVVLAGGDYGPVSIGSQVVVSGYKDDTVYSTLWIGNNTSDVIFFNDPSQLETTVTCFEAGDQVISLLAFDEADNVLGMDSAILEVDGVGIDAKIGQEGQEPVQDLNVLVDSFGPYEFLLDGDTEIVNDNVHTEWIYEGPSDSAYIEEPWELDTKISIKEFGKHVFILKVMNGEQVIAYDTATVNISLDDFYIDIGSDRYLCWKGEGSSTEYFEVISFGQEAEDPHYKWSCSSGPVNLSQKSGVSTTASFSGLGEFQITCELYEGDPVNGNLLTEDTVIVYVSYGFEVYAGKDRGIALEGGSAAVTLDDAFIIPINNLGSFELMADEFWWSVPEAVEQDVDISFTEGDVDGNLRPVVTFYDTGIYELTLHFDFGGSEMEDKVRIWVQPEEEPLMVHAGDDCTIASLTNSIELKDAWVLPSNTSVAWSVQSYPDNYPGNGPQVTFEPSQDVINPTVYFPTTGTYVLRLCSEGQPDIYDDITVTLKPWEISDDMIPPTITSFEAIHNSNPLDGQIDVNGSITISVEAEDDASGSGMSTLELVLLCEDGESIQLDKISEYSVSPWRIEDYILNTYNIPNGSHNLIAYAKDKAGNIGVSNPISFTLTTNTGQNPISNFRVNPECATNLRPELTFTANLNAAFNWALYFDTETEAIASGNGVSVNTGAINVLSLGEGGHTATLKVQVDTVWYEAVVLFGVCTEENLQAELLVFNNLEHEETISLTRESDFESLNEGVVDGNPPIIVTGSKYELIGTANHSQFYEDVTYKVMLYDNDCSNYINVTPNPSFAGYTKNAVNNGILAELDFSTLPNGVYNLELFVRYESVISSVKTQFILDCPLKIGNVKFAQQDLVIPVGGLSLQVVRSYDSFQKDTMGDFGYGWTYALTSLDIKLNEPSATENGPSSGYFDRDVTLTLPDGQRTTFQFELQSCSGPGIKNWKAVYKSPDGVTALLRTKDSEILVYGGGLYGVDYFWEGHHPGILADGESVNLGLEDFSGFTLEAEDGTEYNIERGGHSDIQMTSPLTGEEIYTYESYATPYLESICLSSGETVKFVLAETSTASKPIIKEVLCFSADTDRSALPIPILEEDVAYYRSLALKSIEIQRDDADRIIAINAPSESGQTYESGTPTVKYDYDDDGNLSAVHILRDKAADEYDTTFYNYEDDNLYTPQDHYVTDIQDARGLSPIRYLYDNSGKLIGTMDAKGNVIEIQHDITGKTETVMDRLGNKTVYYYNGRGNVETTIQYEKIGDQEYEAISQTHYAYKSYGAITYNDGESDYFLEGEESGYTNPFPDQPCSVTGNSGDTTYTRYGTQGRVIQTIDPVFNKSTSQYDNSGNLTISSQYKPKRDENGFIDLSSEKVEYEEVSTTQNIYNINSMLVFTGVRKGSIWYSISLSYYDDQNRLLHSVQVDTDDPDRDELSELFSDLDNRIPIDISSFQNGEHVVTSYTYERNNDEDPTYITSSYTPYPGQPYCVIDASGRRQYSEYDLNGNLVYSYYLWTDPTGIEDDKYIINLNLRDAQGNVYETRQIIDTNADLSDGVNSDILLNFVEYNSVGKTDFTIDGSTGIITKYLYDETGQLGETITYATESDYIQYFDDYLDGKEHPDNPNKFTGILSISRTLYDTEGRSIISVGPFDPTDSAHTPVGTETVYDALGRVEKSRRWANVDISYDYIVETGTANVLYISLPQDKLAANAWADADALNNAPKLLAWTVGASADQPVVDNELSYSRTEYDNAGKVWKTYTQNDFGTEICTNEYVYDAAGRQTKVITLPDDSENRTETVSHYDGTRRDYVIDARGFVDGADPADYTTSFVYDELSRVIITVHPPTLIEETDAEAATYTHVGYDGLGRKAWETASIVADGDTVAVDLDAEAKQFRYDISGRLIMVILPVVDDGTSTLVHPIYRYYYDQYGNQTAILDPKGRATVFEYDHLNQQTKKYMPFEVTFADPQPDLTDELYYTMLEGDIRSSLASVSPMFELNEFDEYGRLKVHLDYKEQATGYVYNSRGQLSYKVYYDADSDTTDGVNDYYVADVTDFADNVESYTRLSEKIYYTYDNLGRKVAETVTDASGTPVITYYSGTVYDNEGRVDSVITQNGESADYQYVNYEYHPVTGQKAAVKVLSAPADDPDNFTLIDQTDYSYDNLGRLETVQPTTRNSDVVSDELTTYGYNEVGSRDTIEIDTNGTTGWELRTSYTYNSLNQLTAIVNEKTGPAVVSSFDYTLAADGMRETADEFLEYPSGQTEEEPSIDYTYDNLNRLTDEENNSGSSGYEAHYIYDLAGNRLTRNIVANGQELNTTYTCDDNTDRLLVEEHEDPVAAIPYGDNQRIYAYADTPGGGITYQLPGADSRIGEFKAFWMGLPSVWNTVLFYTVIVLIPVVFFWPVFIRQWSRIRGSIDPLASPDLRLWHRMLCVLLAYIFLIGPEAFQYFANAATQYSDLSTAAWGDDGDVFSYVYDENGSQVYKVYADVTDIETMTPAGIETWLSNNSAVAYDHHIYNLQNRLARVEKFDGWQSVIDATEYRYNPQGIRINKDVNGIVTDYLIDPANHTGYAQVILETTDDGTDLTRIQYTLGDDVISQTKSIWNDGTSSWDANNTQYLLYDGHGSTRQLAYYSSSTGTVPVIDSYNYDGYGVMLSSVSGAEAASNAATSLLYSGEQYDGSLDQYYLRARYYNPANGLFNRMDPYAGNINDPQSLHKYAYVHNNPVNAIDPTGMFTLGGLNISMSIGAIMTSISTYATAAYLWAATNMALITSVSYYAMWTFIISSLWVGAEQQGYVPEITLVGNWTVAKAAQVVSGSVFFLGLMIMNSVPDMERAKIAGNVQTRVYEIRQQMPQNVQGRVTMAAGVAETKAGERIMVLGTSESNAYLRQGITLKSNEMLVSGTGHAEQDVVNFCRQQGWNLLSIGATRPVCDTCVETIAPTGGDIVTPIKSEMLDGAH